MSLKEFMANPQNMERVAERIKARKIERELYNGNTWKIAKKILSDSAFPDALMATHVASSTYREPPQGEAHNAGRDSHTLNTYEMTQKIQGFVAHWRYNFCGVCNKVIIKRATLVNNMDNSVYQKYFIRNGEFVNKVATIAPAKESYRPEEVAQLFGSPLGGEKK